MEVAKSVLMLSAVIFVIASCSQKSSDRVFSNQQKPGSPGCNANAIANKFLVQWEDGTITLEQATDKDSFIKNFIDPNLDKIKHVEYDQKIKLIDPIQTSDIDLFSADDGNSDELKHWGQTMIEVDKVWAKGIRGKGVVVAITDTGMELFHKQLTNQIFFNMADYNFNGIDDDGNGFIDDIAGWNFVDNNGDARDDVGHGTHVAGIIAADHVNGPARGIAPEAKILPLKFIGAEGGDLANAVFAMNYAISRGAKIVNASWGGTSCSDILQNSIKALETRGVLFVSAAGNETANIDVAPVYPAALDLSNQITVAASGRFDWLASFSNYGVKHVHIVAPGDSIYSTFIGSTYSSYARLDGTSMAAPFVSGVAALLWSHRPAATVNQIKEAILSSVDVNSSDYPVKTHGRLNARKAIEALELVVPE